MSISSDRRYPPRWDRHTTRLSAYPRCPPRHAPTPLALGEESPSACLANSTDAVDARAPSAWPRPDVPASLSDASTAEGDDTHTGLLRPAGTRYVKLLGVWMQYHARPRPTAPAAGSGREGVPAVVHRAVHVAAPKPRLHPPSPRPARGAAGGDVWAGLRQVRVGRQLRRQHRQRLLRRLPVRPGDVARTRLLAVCPRARPPAVQDQAAQQLQARSGWGQWPACSRRLGLT